MWSTPSSLGLRTNLFVHAREGSVTQGDGCLVVRTPDNPGYWFGNSLVMPGPPVAGDLLRWEALHEAAHPGAPHRVFQCDGVDGANVDGANGTGADAADANVEAFVRAGYELQQMEVLTASVVVDNGKVDHRAQVRALATDDEWAQQLALRVTIAVQDEGHDAEDYREYAEATQRFQRAMVRDGVARWYGLFEGDRMLAALGLVGTDDFARFQRVETHAQARGRGLCSTLVWRVSSRALSQRPGRQLVMLADEGYHARHIYRSLGYRPVERILSLVRRPDA